jgi:hypothetical protein
MIWLVYFHMLYCSSENKQNQQKAKLNEFRFLLDKRIDSLSFFEPVYVRINLLHADL